MQKSKLIQLLKTFTASELRAFKDFVDSPYFNKKQELVKLYAYLKKLAPQNFPEKKMGRGNVFTHLFPHHPYDEKQLNHLISLLFKLAEQFIGYERFKLDGILPETYTLRDFIDRQQTKSYNYLVVKLKDKLTKQVHQDEHFCYQQFVLAELEEHYFSNLNIRRFDPQLQIAANHFDTYFLAKKLKYSCHMLDRQKLMPEPYQYHLIEEVKGHIESRDFNSSPAITVYFTLLQMLTQEDAGKYFQQFRKHLQTFHSQFPDPERKDLYYFAINFCINQLRLGQKAYARDLMDLYEEGLRSGVLLEAGHISPWTYKNMIRLGINLKRFAFVENVVREYSDKLPEDQRQDAYYFNLAVLQYHKKDYNKALEFLNRVEFSDIHYNLDAKVTLMRIYYEKEETEALFSLISAFRIFLKRNEKVSKRVKEPYQNFVQILYQICKYGAKRKAVILEKIEQTRVLNGRGWLEEVVNGLEF